MVDSPLRKNGSDIAFICQYFHPEQYLTSPAALALSGFGNRVHVICCVPNYGRDNFFEGYSNSLNRSEDWQGVRIDRAWTLARGQGRWRLALSFLVFPLTGSWIAYRKFRRRPDVSLVVLPSPLFQAVVGIFLKKCRRVPCAYWVQDIWPDTVIELLGIRNKILIRFLVASCGWIYRQADVIFVQSKAFGARLHAFGVPSGNIVFLPNTPPSIYRQLSLAEAALEAGLMPGAGFRIVFAGNIGESQDFETILKAARILGHQKDIHWIIIGSGRGLESATVTACEYGLGQNVRFLGRFPEETMPRFFAHADALLVSLRDSPIFNLTIPSKLQSYMACGKPIIGNVAGEAARVINDSGAGIVSRPGVPSALASAVQKLRQLSDIERAEMGFKGVEYCRRNFSQSSVYGRLNSVLQETAAGARAAASFR